MRLTEDPRYKVLDDERTRLADEVRLATVRIGELREQMDILMHEMIGEVTGLCEGMEVLVTSEMCDYAFENRDVLQVGNEMVITDLHQRSRGDEIIGNVDSANGHEAYGIPADMLQEARQQWLDLKAGGQ